MDKDRIAGSAKDFAGKVEGAVGDVTGDAKTAGFGPRARSGGHGAESVRPGQGCRARRHRCRRQLRQGRLSTTAATRFAAVRRPSRKTVQDNPLGALLVAGGIGFALALLMTRPPRRPPPRWRYYG